MKTLFSAIYKGIEITSNFNFPVILSALILDQGVNNMGKLPARIPTEVKDIADAIASGHVKNAKMEWKDDGSVIFTADSPDGNARFTMQKHEFAGIRQESKIKVSKPSNKEERLERVQVLHEQGKTQTEISLYTMTSQKTVSNDVQELKKQGLIK